MADKEEVMSFSEDIQEWAKKYKLESFLGSFSKAGFDTMEVISEITPEDLDWMEIKRPGDRKKIMIGVRAIESSTTDENTNDDNDEEQNTQNETTVGNEEVNELVNLECSKEMKEGRTSVLQLSDKLQAKVLPLLTQGHRIYEGNPLYLAVCKKDNKEVEKLVKKIKEGKLNVDINELCGDSKSTVLHTAISMESKLSIITLLLSFCNGFSFCNVRY